MHDSQTLPSPASSPSLTPRDITSTSTSRKRQRSQSMQSTASSSSPKRSVSEGAPLDSGVSSPRPDDKISTLSLSDPNNDIDAYMAEQGVAEMGEGGLPHATAAKEYSTTQNGTTPSPQEKLSLVDRLKGSPMQAGQTWYVLSTTWYKRWHKACSGESGKEEVVYEKDLGPVDNTSLLDTDGNLSRTLTEGLEIEYVPEEVWSYFTAWYGPPINPLPRKVITRGIAQAAVLEVHPPIFKAFILNSGKPTASTVPETPPVSITVSLLDTVKTLCTLLAKAVSPDSNQPFRVWSVDKTSEHGIKYPLEKFLATQHEKLEQSDKTLEEAMIESGDLFVVEFKQDDKWPVDGSGIMNKLLSLAVLPDIPPPLFSSENNFFDHLQPKKTERDIFKSIKAPIALKSALTGVTGYGRSKPQDPGTLGLGNLGNTCFMNSALQCLAHARELTEYFLTGVYQEELNPDNPLGMHGAIAEAFGVLLHKIWAADSTSSSYSPREFKQQLQRFAPQFSGYQQHDSQELVAFLLDGLHEDLNRVLKKPYVEKPDWEGGGDKELVQLACKSWEGYKQRNDSVIVDLFQGQYQSTLICPECQKVSITFDPFMYLTLPLPVKKKWRHAVFYVPWDLNKPHVKVPVEIGRDASFRDLRQLLGRWMGAIPDNLLTLEIFNHRFYKNLDDSLLCGEMQDNDVIVCFELPCHAQQSRNYKKQPGDPMIVPMFLSDAIQSRQSYLRNSPTLFGYPSIVVIDRDQGTSVDGMYDAVLDRLQRWTRNARDLFTWELGPSATLDEVPIQITGQPVADSMTEIKENGDVVTIEATLSESDLADEKIVDMEEQEHAMDTSGNEEPRKVHGKHGVLTLRLQNNHKEYGTGLGGYGSSAQRFESWEQRLDDQCAQPFLLRDGDAFFCEFDENTKAYYFGDDRSRWEHALWDTWEQFIHPEYEEAMKALGKKETKGISIQDCLDEFTKQERLGEDDLWYCPQCKKHQQATKKFDIWSAPDILVVHLKRFSNSRAMRDKIDEFVDFPVEGLDLDDMVLERQVATRLMAQGVNIEELGLANTEEPLLYDLFGVDEHMGGLGGGHYRAYALNHLSGKWFHFDDSYVTPAKAEDAVNSRAYLLFYRRRTSTPLGGKTHQKIEEARLGSKASPKPDAIVFDTQLPTPPDEPDTSYGHTGPSKLYTMMKGPGDVSGLRSFNHHGSSYPESSGGSSASSPPVLEDVEPPSFDDSQYDDLIAAPMDPLHLASQHFDFPDPSQRASPTSSVGAEPDTDDARMGRWAVRPFAFPSGSYERDSSVERSSSRMISPTGSNDSEHEGSKYDDTHTHDEGVDL